MFEDIETRIRVAVVRTLRRRAERQRQIALDWTVTGAKGVRIMSGEGRIAARIAEALDLAADELEGEAKS